MQSPFAGSEMTIEGQLGGLVLGVQVNLLVKLLGLRSALEPPGHKL
jgi:hypothetical protein